MVGMSAAEERKAEDLALKLDDKLANIHELSYSHVVLNDLNWDKTRFDLMERFLLQSFVEIANGLAQLRALLESDWRAGEDWNERD